MLPMTLTFKTSKPLRAQRSSALPLLLTLMCLLPLGAQAQVYRIVGPDGKVTFSDKPPADPKAKSASGSAGSAPSGNVGGLPYELQQVASKYPVTLYTGNECSPCGSARAMLLARGVPFTEKTVNTNDDLQALQRVSGETALPFLTIGSQQLKGFSDAEWTQYLNAAGYPASSALPAAYRAAAPSPLVVAKVIAPAASATVKAPVAPATPIQPNTNPSGIRF